MAEKDYVSINIQRLYPLPDTRRVFFIRLSPSGATDSLADIVKFGLVKTQPVRRVGNNLVLADLSFRSSAIGNQNIRNCKKCNLWVIFR